MVLPLANKVALVTGGNAGIGQAAAVKFAQAGVQVVVAARRSHEGEETVKQITTAGGQAIFVQTDVSQLGAVQALITKTLAAYGRLDYAFNNAGIIGASSNVHEYPEESWDAVMNINLKGVWLCMKYEIEQMLKQGGGVIINNASVAGVLGGPGITGYRVSKAGVIMLTKAAALDYAAQNIRVNAICPGYIRTPGLERIIDNQVEREAGMIASEPIGRMGTPEEVAETVVWLCSDAASFITGNIMGVDGGMLARG